MSDSRMNRSLIRFLSVEPTQNYNRFLLLCYFAFVHRESDSVRRSSDYRVEAATTDSLDEPNLVVYRGDDAASTVRFSRNGARMRLTAGVQNFLLKGSSVRPVRLVSADRTSRAVFTLTCKSRKMVIESSLWLYGSFRCFIAVAGQEISNEMRPHSLAITFKRHHFHRGKSCLGQEGGWIQEKVRASFRCSRLVVRHTVGTGRA
ncbi:hypothetical protein AOLI_G00151640 [Acnodon oligacanthus]